MTYPLAAARAVRTYRPFQCTLERGGRRATVQAVHLSVSNAPVFGDVLGMRVPGASMTDGLLDVIVVERLSLPQLVLAVAETYVNRHEAVRRTDALRVDAVQISTSPSREISLDGEVGGTTPASFRVLPNAIKVVMPAP